MFDSLKDFIQFSVLLPYLGGIIAFLWSIYLYLVKRTRERDESEFKRFHDVIQKIQFHNNDGKEEDPYIEIQIVSIFELGTLKRYYPISIVYLEHKKKEWEEKDLSDKYKMLGVPAINLALEQIKRGSRLQRLKQNFLAYYEDNKII